MRPRVLLVAAVALLVGCADGADEVPHAGPDAASQLDDEDVPVAAPEPDPDPEPEQPLEEPERTSVTLAPLADPVPVDLSGVTEPDGARLLGDPQVEVWVVPTDVVRLVLREPEGAEEQGRVVRIVGGPVERTALAGEILVEPTVDVDDLTLTFDDDGTDVGAFDTEPRSALAIIWDDPETEIVTQHVTDVRLLDDPQFRQEELGHINYSGPSPMLVPGFETALEFGVSIDVVDDEGDRVFWSFDEVVAVDVAPWRDLGVG